MKTLPFYICTGFHRSGTSLVAATMNASGVDMGPRLMGASFANPNGHFEDQRLVDIHDRLLNLNATDWRYCSDAPLHVLPSMHKKMEAYYTDRCAIASLAGEECIGAKDPRASLFLSTWHEVTNGELKTLLVFRDWKLSISSILKRHSRQLVQFRSPIFDRCEDIQFWKTPDLAAKMWVSSTRSILNWFKEHDSTSLLFEQAALIHDRAALSKLAHKKNFDQRLFSHSVYESGLMQQYVPEVLVEALSESIIEECNQLQTELHELSDLNRSEQVRYHPRGPLVEKLLNYIPQRQILGELPSLFVQKPDLEGLVWEDLFFCLQNFNVEQANLVDWNRITVTLDPNQLDKVFALAMKWQMHDLARNIAQKALNLSPRPWRFMQLGDVSMREKKYDEARDRYTQAHKASPENATFFAKLSTVDTVNGDFEAAQGLLKQAEQLDAQKPAVKQAYQFFKDQLRARERLCVSKDDSASRYRAEMKLIDQYQPVVDLMTKDKPQGFKLDRYMCQSAFIMRNNKKWLLDAAAALPVHARRCFLDYTTAQFEKLFSRDIIEAELLSERDIIWEESSRYEMNIITQPNLPSVGVCLHAFYPHLLPQVFAYLRKIPNIKHIVVTCTESCHDALATLFSFADYIKVIKVENRGRDILPWLRVAADEFKECDTVLKLHTKKTPHDPFLASWRNQLYWQLMGSDFIPNILRAFKNKADLGLIIPNYHPNIMRDINWGDNAESAQSILSSFEIPLSDEVFDFAAGSMFWYRPAALRQLTDTFWESLVFPDECGQTDGTVMHAIERILKPIAKMDGFDTLFVEQVCT